MNAVERAGLEQVVRRLAGPVASGLGLEIVETAFGHRGKRLHLRIDVDRPGSDGVRLDDCARLSGALEVALDETDAIPEGYVLEVSSPGIDRPIRTDDDVRRNTGRAVIVETREPIEGRRTFNGILVGSSGDVLRIRERDAAERLIPRALIVKARQEIDFRR